MFKKKHKGNLSQDLLKMRTKFREFDKVLDDLQQYFYKLEKKMEKNDR